MALAAGAQLGRYRIIETLGAGGMGVVYRARDETLQRDVAIKVLPASFLADDHSRHRFRKEALALARLNHPNIAAVYDAGDEGEITYLVMECVPGESLASRLRTGPLPVTEALRYGVQVAEALAEAHDQGIVHRDLKPANLMITPRGRVKVLDFGLAKLLTPSDGASVSMSRSEVGSLAGTPLYMSPEQAFGEAVDTRTDLWSLGVVLYESLAGRAPFAGTTDLALLHAVSQQAPPSLRSLRAEVPAPVEALIARAMTKDPNARFQTATAMGEEAATVLASLSAPTIPASPAVVRLPRRLAITGAAIVVLLGLVIGWYALQTSHRSWAHRQALTEITRLFDADLPLAGSHLLQKALGYLPGDSALTGFAATHLRRTAVTSTPTGVAVAIQDYVSPDSAWQPLGTTPLAGVMIPKGYFRWRLTEPSGTTTVLAPESHARMSFALDSASGAPPGMVRVPANKYGDMISFIGWVGPFDLPTFDIDKFEVTNAEYQQFVDSGGYRKQEYWREPFVDQEKRLTWGEAMPRFRDQSGRPGPSTWSGGHYPEGKADYPVSGVSWYEASAYATFRGKQLPTMAQWHDAAPSEVTRFIGLMSNIAHTSVAAVGKYRGLGPFGTYDMDGNVREWVINANTTGDYFILGGAWGSPGYLYDESETLPGFDRSEKNGIRCVRNSAPMPPGTLQPVRMLKRDFEHYVPASDAVYRAYQVMYSYDKTPLNARVEGVVEQTADWRLEKVSYDAAYGHERITAFLYLPTHVKPPYQTVLFFPSARVLFYPDSRSLGDLEFFDYIVQSGRAVLYPIYQDTYERRHRGVLPGGSTAIELTTQRSKDVARSLDYLQSRPDILHDDLAYLGVSMGAAEGAIYATVSQDRLKTAIFLDGGFFLDKPTPGGDQADFVPRLKKPVLMVNGRYDATFSHEEAQLPMFRMLGTPAGDKHLELLETSHDVTGERTALVRVVLAWLDKYLGRVE